mmetsp:Transcript_60587/g.141107  ORF Transcript_60587/g.141107 Transcript_60587/m.141107 type:complete len:574 (-) Transcript_60587:200-1921(-)|eukprot:CAMPEP_0171077690 /NCGR_PEP_ID=MMETSP0766_2-20121228/14182_1 /TAXON_ID=439317 /ORGANISM="Gambierdiscus australes, Strain CAWD 149" /LENGTH=573 /DNA_ID=CAMNT_0011534765 /DNA_START=57 /DNA_END=1778 /DNA_ORIENTATION=-
MALPDSLRELLGKAENNAAKLLLVAIGMVILVRLKLVLFAAALPVMAYWHFSNQLEDGNEAESAASDGRATGADADGVWPPEDDREEDEVDEDDACGFQPDEHGHAPLVGGRTDNDPYDQSFWSHGDAGASTKRTAPWRNVSRSTPAAASTVPAAANGDDDAVPGNFSGDLVAGERSPAKHFGMSWVADADLDDTQDLDLGLSSSRGPAGRSNANAKDPLGGRDGMSDLLDGLGDLGFGDSGKMPAFGGSSTLGSNSVLDDFDLGGPDGLDFLSMGGGKGRGKGKGKPKGGDKGGPRDPMAPREPNPKQVFVANVGDLVEEEIRSFFEEVGEVDRLKVLRNPDGGSKGVCFVTFRTEEQAQKALSLHGSSLEGKNLVVRMAHGGNKGSEKGGDSRGKGGLDRFGGSSSEGPLDLGGSERFGAAFGMDRDRERGDRGDRSGNMGGKGGRGGKGAGGRRIDRGEMDDLLEDALADGDGPIRPADFDFAARRFLSELRARDRTEGSARFQEAIDMVIKYTSSKDRSSVRKWPAYIFALLQKFDPNLWEELRERDAERKREKGGGSGVGLRERRSFD